MKASSSAGIEGLKGKVGQICGQVIALKNDPYSVLGLPRSAAQQETNTGYAEAVQTWRTASDEERKEWEEAGAPLNISGFDYLLKYAVARYDKAKYDHAKYS